MSRKSRANAQSVRRKARVELIAGAGLLLFVAWMGIMLLMQRPALLPIDRNEAIPLATTLVRAEKTWSRRFGQKTGQQDGYRLYVTEGIPLTGQTGGATYNLADAPFLLVQDGWESIRGAEEWPIGTKLTLLLDPQNQKDILSLTKEGVELIPFEETMSVRIRQREGNLRLAILCFAADGGGAIALALWYRRKTQQATRRDQAGRT